MFKRLLVPLDGSHLAEAVLPMVAGLATALHIPVTLVHVVEENAPQEIHGERHLTNEAQALEYLAEVGQRAFPSQITVERHVHTSKVDDVARSIVSHVTELESDLVVMCTHGRSGLSDWLFGTIAQQVINQGKTPVLLVQAQPGNKTHECIGRNILVGLDQNPEHEQGLRVAAQLAQVCPAYLHLVVVVPTMRELSMEAAASARLLPGSTSAILNLSQQQAAEYLQHHVNTLQAQGITVSAEVVRGDPVTMIAQSAQKAGAGLVVLATHGKTAMDAFWSGSLTPQLARRMHLPLLLIPVHD